MNELFALVDPMPWMALIPLTIGFVAIVTILVKSKENTIAKFGGRKTLGGILGMYVTCLLLISGVITAPIWKSVFIVTFIATVGGNAVEHIAKAMKEVANGAKK